MWGEGIGRHNKTPWITHLKNKFIFTLYFTTIYWQIHDKYMTNIYRQIHDWWLTTYNRKHNSTWPRENMTQHEKQKTEITMNKRKQNSPWTTARDVRVGWEAAANCNGLISLMTFSSPRPLITHLGLPPCVPQVTATWSSSSCRRKRRLVINIVISHKHSY